MNHPRIVFLDVDGTLIDHSQRLTAPTVEAIRAARAAGHLVYLSTGRSRAEIPDVVRDIGFDGEITAGGGFIESAGELLAERTMPAATTAEVVGFFRANDIEYTLQGFEAAYPSEGLLARLRPLFAEAGITRKDRLVETMTFHREAPLEGIAKATFFGSDPRTFATVRDGLGSRFHVITGTIPYLGEAGGEVSLEGVHKGAAITQLVDHLGLDLIDAIAIGDSVNDIEMLQTAGVGIAMGNADATVKSVADEITASVEDDGVAAAFIRHGLVQRV